MKALLEKTRPLFGTWIALILGVALGLLWAWQIAPMVWTDAGPVHLSDAHKQEWLKLAALQYEETGDRAQAERLLIEVGQVDELLSKLINENSTSDPVVSQQLTRLREVYASVEDNATAIQQKEESRAGPSFVLCLGGVIVLIIASAVVTVLPGMPTLATVRELLPTLRGGAEGAAPSSEARLAGILAAQRMAETDATDYTQTGAGPPIGQYMTTYLMGDDLYDDSFSVETASGEFLGETGAGISETIGVGDPKKVTAIEVWLFDKNDIRTITKVLMTEYAFNDETLSAKLAPKGEAVLAQPGEIVILETQTLRIQARIVDMAYGEPGPLPPNSYFERLTIELAAWVKAEPAQPSDAFADTMSF
jgi:hypothetical protein